MLEKDGKDQLDRSCEKLRSITESQGAEEYPTWIRKRKANWIGHICVETAFYNGLLKER